ncbi:MAG: hypothetical protein IKY87_04265 [Paludibacteraceae bacterium]|nr:hypothetical protein [Paludibacteraceae bacterium]
MKYPILFLGFAAILTACHPKQTPVMISETTIQASIAAITALHPDVDTASVVRGVEQLAALWNETDGSESDFKALVSSSYAGSCQDKEVLYQRLAHIIEQCSQSADLLNNTLQEPTTLTGKGEPTSVDWIISGYSPMSHFAEDMFANKIAHICVLNFPHYTLAEKNALGSQWTRQEWAYARMGDMFHTRVPGNVIAAYSQALSEAENYIAGYNIMMHCLRNEQGEQLWQEPMALLSHWNLRDELKSNYAAVPHALEKQEMIYQVMLRIIRQEIPACVVNNEECVWYPQTNRLEMNSKSLKAEREEDTRYQQIINIFHALQAIDKHRTDAPSHVLRTFNEDLQIPFEEIETLFTQLIQSEEVKQVAQIISERLGRNLRPYDIWYDGFKSRSAISEDHLTAQTQQLYPDAKAFEKDMPRMLMELGFAANKANEVASHIIVEAARGSGHARPCVGREQPARLRTRVSNKGMDYKGYNIAVHEFGHNVEEVISLYDIDYYTLAGIPNTGFTEASAFLFQERDMPLLGYEAKDEKGERLLDMIWGMYEIMGVSLVDMRMWQWLYAHPTATAAELREAVLAIAAEVWNEYYAPVLGEKDSPLLGIYSHMVGYALYLPAYPIGNLVQYQLEEYLSGCSTPEEWANEYTRIYQQGCLTPDAWMRGAVGQSMSVEPILHAVRKVLK